MNKMKEKAEQVLFEINQNNFNLGGKMSISSLLNLNLRIILEFAKECCELQKQECANNTTVFTILDEFGDESDYEVSTKESILNCKNVCDE